MDKTILGVKAGLLAGIIVGAISLSLSMLGFCRLCLIKTGGGFFLGEMLTSPKITAWTALGWVNHLIISMVLGIIWVYVFYFTGKDYAITKGLLMGILVWTVDYAIISPILGYLPENVSPLDLAIILSYHVLFGVLVALYIVRFGRLTARKTL